MINIIGWIGSISFSLCALPQAVLCARQGHARGLDPLFILMWGLGEVCMTTYVLMTIGWDWPLMVNYLFNFGCLLVLARYRFKPRKENEGLKCTEK